MSIFKKATKKRRKLRLAIDGVSGSGKTMTALEIATAIADAEGGRVALLDTEHGSAADYANLFDFDMAAMKPPYNPERLVKLAAATAEDGYPVLVIDGLSPFWNGSGGTLEIVDKAATNKFSGWKEGTPKQNAMVNALLAYPGHVIVTMRSKADFVVSADGVPKKVGMAPEQRAGIEYEFQFMLSMKLEGHVATVTKCRVVEEDQRWARLMLGSEIPKPGGDLAEEMLAWLEDGTSEEEEAAAAAQLAAQRARAAAAAARDDEPAEPAQPAAAAAPPAVSPAAVPAGVPAWLAKTPDEKAPQRDERIAYRVLVLDEKAGAVAADEHVSTAVVRNARKKWEAARERGDWPRDPTSPAGSAQTSAASSTPLAAPTPTTSGTTSPSPVATQPTTTSEPPAQPTPAPAEAPAPAQAPQAVSAPPAAPSGDADPFAAIDQPSPWSGERQDRLTSQQLALAQLQPDFDWSEAIEKRCSEKFGFPLAELSVDQAEALLEELRRIEFRLRERAPA